MDNTHKIHTHPQMEKDLNVPEDHCIVDRKALESKIAENIIVDLYEMRASLILPMEARQMEKVENIRQYSYIEKIISVLFDKYKIDTKDVHEILRTRDKTEKLYNYNAPSPSLTKGEENKYMPNQKEIKIKIKFFLERKGIKEIVKIHKIKVGFRRVTIYTERPGILIGKRGENCDELKKELNLKIEIIEFDPFYGTY